MPLDLTIGCMLHVTINAFTFERTYRLGGGWSSVEVRKRLCDASSTPDAKLTFEASQLPERYLQQKFEEQVDFELS